MMKIANNLGNAVVENIVLNNGVFVPLNIQQGIPLHFAMDNVDSKIDSPDGKSEYSCRFSKNSKVNCDKFKIR